MLILLSTKPFAVLGRQYTTEHCHTFLYNTKKRSGSPRISPRTVRSYSYCCFENSDNNDASQINDQEIEDVDASNEAENNASIDNGSDNYSLDKDNEQKIKGIDDGSDASNEAANDSNLDNDSDNNDLSVQNDQEIDDVNDGSSASNDGWKWRKF